MKEQMTEKLKNRIPDNRGITLIALVITIIVMLILVAVTISMAVNGGLFEYVGKATKDTQNAINEEQELGSGKVTIGEKTYNSIDEYINKKELPQGIKVGDYVNYTPDTGTYKVADGENGTGYTTADGHQSFTTETGENSLQWRILSIDEGTGEIELISATPAQSITKLYLEGADGYNHGVDILNDLCGTLYSKTVNGKTVATARSINIEDINKKTNYTTTTGAVQINKIPNLYTREVTEGITTSEGLNDGVVNDEITRYSTVTGYTSNNISVSYVTYNYIMDGFVGEMSIEFALKELGINTAPKLLFSSNNSTTEKNWIATRGVGEYYISVADSNVYDFALYYLHGNGHVEPCYHGSGFKHGLGVRPVVLLNSNTKLTKDTANSTNEVNYWNIEF